MSKLVILLLFMLISYAACDVTISNPEKSVRLGNAQSYKIRCLITAPDVFDRFSNPQYTSSIQSDPSLTYATTGNEHDLDIKSMNVFIAGVWTCYSKQGNSDNITLKFSPSVITPAKKEQTLIKDQPGAIYIDIRGYPQPDFVWKKNDTVLNITDRYSVASNGTLLISKVQTGDNGTYAATATKDFYTAESGNIVVKLLVAPSINGTSIRESRTSGGNISFECSASGVPTPNITWTKGSDVITNGGRFTISASGLLIMDIEPNDAGDYTFVAANSVGTKELTFSLLSVHVPPVIAPLSPNEEVEKGKSLSVNCNATGSPTPTVEWSKNGIVLPTSQQTKSPGKSVLTLTNIQTDQGGVYECSAMNAAVDSMGNVIKPSQSVQVNVVYPPQFQNVVETFHVRLNSPARILCNAIGIPVPEMKLSYGSKDLQVVVTANSTSSSLTYRINKTSTDDLGVYTCAASSRLNTIEKKITLSVPLDKPEIYNVKSTCNSVSFSWSHDTQNYIKVSSYQVTVTRSADQVQVKTELASSNTSQALYTGLEENTEYELAVKQKTDVDNIGYESSKKTTTPSCMF
ncbi:neural cell adhesion molecule 1-like isoform X1 [Paramuricea clavata]|uniref:Neural cell adhesion molecule 1-like isoform X1 n=1 Tax=Paramuricea clavata TaxID=317549 RepID=A0A7D9I4K0_PARCT|nr:neural cell adhesion molecule 1-like isoform X1 [Paramuricea clavata]